MVGNTRERITNDTVPASLLCKLCDKTGYVVLIAPWYTRYDAYVESYRVVLSLQHLYAVIEQGSHLQVSKKLSIIETRADQ